jgi:hypothetical protein
MKGKRMKNEARRRAFWSGFASVFTPPEVLAARNAPLRLPKIEQRHPVDPWARVHDLLRDASKTVMGDRPCKAGR